MSSVIVRETQGRERISAAGMGGAAGFGGAAPVIPQQPQSHGPKNNLGPGVVDNSYKPVVHKLFYLGAASDQKHKADYQKQGDNSGEIEHGGDNFGFIHKSLEAMKAAIKQNIPYPVPIRIPAGENDSKETVGIINEAPNQAIDRPEKNSDNIFNWPGVKLFFTGSNFTLGGKLTQDFDLPHLISS